MAEFTGLDFGAPTGASAASRGVRNNNPGNIRHSDSNQWEGASANQADPSFVQFDSPVAGLRAMGKTIQSYRNDGVNSIQDIVSRWAPSNENDVGSYVESVAGSLGIDPTAPLEDGDIPAVMSAMVRHENGGFGDLSPTDFIDGWIQAKGTAVATDSAGNEVPDLSPSGVAGTAVASMSKQQKAVNSASERIRASFGTRVEDVKGNVDPEYVKPNQTLNDYLTINSDGSTASHDKYIALWDAAQAKAKVEDVAPVTKDATTVEHLNNVGEALKSGTARLVANAVAVPATVLGTAALANSEKSAIDAFNQLKANEKQDDLIAAAKKFGASPETIAKLEARKKPLTEAQEKELNSPSISTNDKPYRSVSAEGLLDVVGLRDDGRVSTNDNIYGGVGIFQAIKTVADTLFGEDSIKDDTAQEDIEKGVKELQNAADIKDFGKLFGTNYDPDLGRNALMHSLGKNSDRFLAVVDKAARDQAKAGGVADYAAASAQVLAAEGELAADLVSSIADHPWAAVELVAENLPQLLAGVINKNLVLLQTSGYSVDVIHQGLAAVMEANDGRLPTGEEITDAVMAGVGAGLVEQASGVVELKTLKSLSTGATTKALPKATAVTLAEGPVEGTQTFLESEAKQETATGKEILTGAQAGVLSSGIIQSTPASPTIVKESLKDVAEVVVKSSVYVSAAKRMAAEDAANFKKQMTSEKTAEAIATGDFSSVIAEGDKQVALTAMAVRNSAEDVTPEEKATIALGAEEIHANAYGDYLDANDKVEAATTKREQKAAIKERDAAKAKFDQADVALRAIQSPVEQVEEQATQVDTSAVLEATESSPEIVEAAKRILHSARTNPDTVSNNTLIAVAKSGFLSAEDVQAAKDELRVRRTMEQATDSVRAGDTGFIGLVQHRELVNSALDRGDTATAQRQFDTLSKWSESHQNKTEVLTRAFNSIVGTKNKLSPELAAEVKQVSRVQIHFNSNKPPKANPSAPGFIDQLELDRKAIQATVTQLGAQLGRAASVVAAPAAAANSQPVTTPTPSTTQTGTTDETANTSDPIGQNAASQDESTPSSGQVRPVTAETTPPAQTQGEAATDLETLITDGTSRQNLLNQYKVKQNFDAYEAELVNIVASRIVEGNHNAALSSNNRNPDANRLSLLAAAKLTGYVPPARQMAFNEKVVAKVAELGGLKELPSITSGRDPVAVNNTREEYLVAALETTEYRNTDNALVAQAVLDNINLVEGMTVAVAFDQLVDAYNDGGFDVLPKRIRAVEAAANAKVDKAIGTKPATQPLPADITPVDPTSFTESYIPRIWADVSVGGLVSVGSWNNLCVATSNWTVSVLKKMHPGNTSIKTVTMGTRNPAIANSKTIDHYAAEITIDGVRYFVDKPQHEMVTPFSAAQYKVLDKVFAPRFIEASVDGIQEAYQVTAFEAASMINTVSLTLTPDLQGVIDYIFENNLGNPLGRKKLHSAVASGGSIPVSAFAQFNEPSVNSSLSDIIITQLTVESVDTEAVTAPVVAQEEQIPVHLQESPPFSGESIEDGQPVLDDAPFDWEAYSDIQTEEEVEVGSAAIEENELTENFNLGAELTANNVAVPKGTPLADRLKMVNWIAEFFNAKAPRASEISGNALAQVNDFFGKLASEAGNTWLAKRMGVEVATPAQVQNKERLLDAHSQFVETLRALHKPKSSAYRSDDMMQFLLREDGTYHPNVEAAITVAIYSWMVTQAAGTLYNDDAAISGILKLKSGTEVTEEMRFLLDDVGTNVNTLVDSLGKNIAKTLNITPKGQATEAMVGKLHHSLGNMALAIMHTQGLVTKNDVSRNEMFALTTDEEGKALSKEGVNALVEGAPTATFYRAASQPKYDENGNEDGQTVDAIITDAIEANKNSEGMLEKLFKIQSKDTGPVWELTELTQKTMKGTSQKISKRVKDALNVHQSRKHYLNTAAISFTQLPLELQRTIGGYNHDIEGTVHVANRLAAKAKNNAIDKQLNDLHAFVNDPQHAEGKPFYFSHEVWKMMRIGQISNTVSTQNSKIHRHLIAMESHRQTIGIDQNGNPQEQFLLALAEAFGVKTDGQLNTVSLEQINTKMQDPVVVAGVKAIQAGSTDADAIAAALDSVGGDTYAYHGLVQLAAYQTAFDNGQTSFETDLFREVDGKTNGPIIGMLQFGSASSAQELASKIRKGGLYGPGVVEHFGQWISSVTSGVRNRDAYQEIAIKLEDLIQQRRSIYPQDVPYLDAIEGIFGRFTEDGDRDTVTSDGRNLVKYPLMLTVYGSGNTSVQATIGNTAIDLIHKKIASIVTSGRPGAMEELRILAHQVGVMSGNTNALKIHPVLKMNLESRIQDGSIANIKDTVIDLLGKPLTTAINEEYFQFKDERTHTNNVLGVISDIYRMVYNDKVDRLVAEKTRKGQAVDRLYTLTLAEDRKIKSEISHILPTIATFYSKESGNIDENIDINGIEAVRQYAFEESLTADETKSIRNTVNKLHPRERDKAFRDAKSAALRVKRAAQTAETIKKNPGNEYRTEQVYPKGVRPGPKSIKTHATRDMLGDVGVRGAILAIHSMDAAVMIMVMEKLELTNVHDAAILSLLETVEGAQVLNQAFMEVMREMSIPQEANTSLLRAIKGLKDYATETKQSKEMWNKVEVYIKTVEETGPDGYLVTPYSTVTQFVSETKRKADLSEEIKNDALDSVVYAGQYYVEGGQKQVKENEYAEGYTLAEQATNAGIEAGESAAVKADRQQRLDQELEDIREGKPVNLNYFGSTTGDDFIDTFVDEKTQDVNAMDLLDVFDNIDVDSHVTETPGHTAHLRKIMSSIVQKVMTKDNDSFKLHQGSSTTDQPRGAMTGSDIYIQNQVDGTVAPTLGPLVNSLRMSSQEILAHEAVHMVTATMLDQSSIARREIQGLYEFVKSSTSTRTRINAFMNDPQMDPADPGYRVEFAAAKERHDYIFAQTGSKNTGIHEFVAHGLTNKNFIKFLEGITAKDISRSWWSGTTLTDKLTNGFLKLLDLAVGEFGRTRGLNAQAKLDRLVKNLVGIEQRKKGIILNSLEVLSNGNVLALKGLSKGLNATKKIAVKVAKTDAVSNSRFKVIKVAGRASVLALSNTPTPLRKLLGNYADTLAGQKYGFGQQIATEAMGHGKGKRRLLELNRISNMIVDQARKQLQTAVTRASKRLFDYTLSKAESTAMTKVVLKADLSSLVADYSSQEIADMLSTPSILKAAIAAETARLTGPNRFFYRRMSRNLGHFMAQGVAIEEHTLLNARNIALLGGTSLMGELDVDTATSMEPIIDRLSSLYALSFTAQGHKTAVSTIIRKEAVKGPINGFTGSMSMHQDLKDEAFEKTFGSDPTLMIKGYTKEHLNPRTALIMAPASRQQELADKGYDMMPSELRRDSLDPVQDRIMLYVNKDGGMSTYMAGIVSLMSNRAKGTNQIQIRDQLGDPDALISGNQDAGVLMQRKQAAINEIFADRVTPVGGSTFMVPVMNTQGQVAAYRYMMSEHTKDTLMDKHNDFHDALGSMAGALADKQATPKINNMTISALHDQYRKDFGSHSGTYVEIGPNSPDPRLREIYFMMPVEARQEIKRVWGTNRMLVAKDVVNLVFGQRKLSIYDPFQIEEQDRTATQEVFVKVMEGIFGKRIGVRLRRGEDWIKEFVKEGKDFIVVKTGVVTAANIMSNNLLLKMMGVPLVDVIRYQAEGLDATIRYQKDHAEELQLQQELAVQVRLGGSRRAIADLNERISILQNELAVNPIHVLVEEGVMQSIVEDIDDEGEQFSFKSALATKIDDFTSHPNLSVVKKVAKAVYLSHDQPLYKALNSAVRMSDFVARYALYKHLVKTTEMGKDAAIEKIVETFINYDLPTHRLIQYGNDVGLLWFTKYFIRVQKVIATTLRDNPADSLMVLLLQNVFGGFTNISESLFGFEKNPASLVGTPLNAISGAASVVTIEPIKALL